MLSEIKKRLKQEEKPRRGWYLFMLCYPVYWVAQKIVATYEYYHENH